MRQTLGECPVIDLVPAPERDEKLAHAVAMLQHFFLQLASGR
ncbi:hypothetical protein D8I24_4030 (plasmid) [Cupriavidus necator H850]|nr:hypothetical protein D8I24_4030 [Cupriavidus necator H850]